MFVTTPDQVTVSLLQSIPLLLQPVSDWPTEEALSLCHCLIPARAAADSCWIVLIALGGSAVCLLLCEAAALAGQPTLKHARQHGCYNT